MGDRQHHCISSLHLSASGRREMPVCSVLATRAFYGIVYCVVLVGLFKNCTNRTYAGVYTHLNIHSLISMKPDATFSLEQTWSHLHYVPLPSVLLVTFVRYQCQIAILLSSILQTCIDNQSTDMFWGNKGKQENSELTVRHTEPEKFHTDDYRDQTEDPRAAPPFISRCIVHSVL